MSALDVSIQAQVINLLIDLQKQNGFSYLFIAHDLAVVAHISHRVAVMYLGRIVEIGEAMTVLDRPRHPYTLGLLNSSAAMVEPGERLHQIDGMAPRIDSRPSGCPFRPRCERALPACADADPQPS